MTMTTDYRASHLNKGADYQKHFEDYPYRAVLWVKERALLDRLVPPAESAHLRYLDFACGTGRIIGHLASRVASATGVDVSDSMLAEARKHVVNARFVKGDITVSDGIVEGPFDLITAFRFFPNAQPELRTAAMRALIQLLVPGGRLIFNNHRNPENLRNKLKRVIGRAPGGGITHRECLELISRSGLKLDRFYHLGIWPGGERSPIGATRVVGAIDGFVERIAGMAPLANDIVYVCRRT